MNIYKVKAHTLEEGTQIHIVTASSLEAVSSAILAAYPNCEIVEIHHLGKA